MTSASARIASFAVRFNDVPLSDEQRHVTYRAFLDTFAVAIAGQHDQAPRIAHGYLQEIRGTGNATVWSSGESLPAESAAWLNAVTAHVLDYDDVMTIMRGHVSVALVPALIALSQLIGADGRRYSSAYTAGFEVIAKISKAMAIPHYTKGWHSTSTIGVVGAVAACSVLLGLDERQIAHALGLAVAQAAGTRQNFGTMAKSFQAGLCGASAVRAVMLARAGFTAAGDALDGAFGYPALYGNKEDLSAALETLGASPLEIDATGIDVKKYPCCYATHKALDGVLMLRSAHELTLDHVGSVEVISSANGLEALICPHPKTGLEAKFSMEYAMAAALLDGGIRLASFDDAQVMRPVVQAFFSNVTKKESRGAVLPRWVNVSVRLKNGAKLEQRVEIGRGDAADPLSDDDLIKKVEDCFAYGQCKWQARPFALRVFAMTHTNIDDLIRPLYLGSHHTTHHRPV